MRYLRVFLILLAAMILEIGLPTRSAAQGSSNDILLFPLKGDKDLAPAAAEVLKATLRQNRTIRVTEFRADLPTLRRSIIERQITRQDLDAKDQVAKERIARAIEASYFLEGDVFQENQIIFFRLTATSTRSGQQYRFSSQATRAAGSGASRESLILSVGNDVATKFMAEVLGVMPPAAPPEVNISLPSALTDNGRPAPAPPATPSNREEPAPEPEPQPQPGPAPEPTVPEPQPVDPSLEVQAYVTQAESLAGAGNLAGAIQAMKSAVNLSSQDPLLRIKLADYYRERGLETEAAAEMQEAVRLGGRDAQSRLALARQFSAAGEAAQAAELYRALLNEDPGNAEARLEYGDTLWNLGQSDNAALEYAQVANENRTMPEPHERLARLFASKGRFLEAGSSLNASQDLRGFDRSRPVELSLYRSLIQSADIAYYRNKEAMEQASRSFSENGITREEFYNRMVAITTQSEQLADFLTDIAAPQGFTRQHLHRTLAASLQSQSLALLQDWLRTNDAAKRSESDRFSRESAVEMEKAAALDRQQRN